MDCFLLASLAYSQNTDQIHLFQERFYQVCPVKRSVITKLLPDLSAVMFSISVYRPWWSTALMSRSRTSRGSGLHRVPNGKDTPLALGTWSSWKHACLWPHKLLNLPNSSMSKLFLLQFIVILRSLRRLKIYQHKVFDPLSLIVLSFN